MIKKELLEKLSKKAGFYIQDDGEIHSPWREEYPINDEINDLIVAIIKECIDVIQNDELSNKIIDHFDKEGEN